MDDAAEPLGPVLVFSEKHQPIATGLFPLLAKMKRQHAEGRGRRDRGTRGFSAFLDRAFPGRTAGANLLAFLHETSIVIREPRCSESPQNTSYPLSTLPWIDDYPEVPGLPGSTDVARFVLGAYLENALGSSSLFNARATV